MAYEYQSFATLGVNLNRQNYGALDISQVFASQADLDYYLSKGTKTDGVSEYWYKVDPDTNEVTKVVPYPYEGQVLATVFGGKVNVYVLALDENNEFVTQNVGDTSAVEAAVADLEKLIGTIPTDEEGNPLASDVIAYINKKTEGIATDTALEELQGKVSGLESAIEKLPTEDTNTTYTFTSGTNGKFTVKASDSADAIEIDTGVVIPTNVSDFNNDAGYQTANDVAAAIAEINHAVFQKVDTVPEASEAVANVLYLVPSEDNKHLDIYAKINDQMVLIDDTDTDLSNYITQEELDAVTIRIQTLEGLPHLTVEDVNTQIDAKLTAADYDGKISTAKQEAIDEALAGVLVKSVNTDEFTIDSDGKLTANIIAATKISGLATTYATIESVDTKIGTVPVYSEPDDEGNKTVITPASGIYSNVYTKEEVADLIADITGGESAADVLAKLNTYTGTNDARVLAVENEVDTLQGLVGNATTADTSASGLFANIESIEAKLENIEDNAQVNVIESILVNGTALNITDKAVDIPLASTNVAGTVILGAEFTTNETTNALEVKTLNVNKLVQTEGEYLELNGGTANGFKTQA